MTSTHLTKLPAYFLLIISLAFFIENYSSQNTPGVIFAFMAANLSCLLIALRTPGFGALSHLLHTP